MQQGSIEGCARLSTLVLFTKVAVALAVAGYVGACVLLYIFQARFIFPGAFMPLPPGIEAESRALGLEPFLLQTPDGESLHLLHRVPGPGRPVLVVFHGNASYPEDYGFLYAGWVGDGYGIVAPVARGYPRSSGSPGGEAMLSDALAIRDWIATTYPDNPVVVFGQSLGTAPAVHMAARREVAGVILISPFTSMLALVDEKVPWIPARLLLASPFRSDLDAPDIRAPVLIFHGERDALVPIEQGRALAALIKAPVTLEAIRIAGHAEGLFGVATQEQIASFLATISP
jgi:uncharacterized protein